MQYIIAGIRDIDYVNQSGKHVIDTSTLVQRIRQGKITADYMFT